MLRIEAMSGYLPHMLNGSLFVSENKFYLLKNINTSDQNQLRGLDRALGSCC